MRYCQFLVIIIVFLQPHEILAQPDFRDCPHCPEMVVIPQGQFIQGSDFFESEMPPTPVTIPADFALGRFEITFDEWEACEAEGFCTKRRTRQDHGWGKGRRPVIYVTWDDTQDFVGWLNEKVDGNPYRLPSEAEWEYAARAGDDPETKYFWGNEIDCGLANYGRLSEEHCLEEPTSTSGGTERAGSYGANGFGLFDMHGNVWEWVEDCWHQNYADMPEFTRNTGAAWTDPEMCTFHVIRGGSWVNVADRLRSSNRSRLGTVNRDFNFGFRVARTLP